MWIKQQIPRIFWRIKDLINGRNDKYTSIIFLSYNIHFNIYLSVKEAIELNLARAVKSGGLRKDDIGRGNMALHAITLLGVDPVQLAKANMYNFKI